LQNTHCFPTLLLFSLVFFSLAVFCSLLTQFPHHFFPLRRDLTREQTQGVPPLCIKKHQDLGVDFFCPGFRVFLSRTNDIIPGPPYFSPNLSSRSYLSSAFRLGCALPNFSPHPPLPHTNFPPHPQLFFLALFSLYPEGFFTPTPPFPVISFCWFLLLHPFDTPVFFTPLFLYSTLFGLGCLFVPHQFATVPPVKTPPPSNPPIPSFS